MVRHCSPSILAAAGAIPLAYVFALYVLFDGRESRNHPRNVRVRIGAVLVNCLLSLALTRHLLFDEVLTDIFFRVSIHQFLDEPKIFGFLDEPDFNK
jgi:hypothetical protein